ncbi:MAG TPA: hypothetical protein VGP07_00500 [Polyangia bacterium]
MAWVCLCAAIITGSGHAAEPAPELDKEIAWARAAWPDALRGMHFHSPLRKLLAWAPRGGAVTAYLYTNDFACRRATLSRGPWRNDADEGDADETLAPTALIAKIIDRPQMDSGERLRNVTFVEVGALLSGDDGFTTEAQGPDGRWQEEGGGSGYGPNVYGALSYADDHVARWDGEPMEIHPYCAGPTEWLACPTGGERPCERCEEADVMMMQLNALGGHSKSHGNRPVTCHDACPTYPEGAGMKRVSAFASRVQPWQPRNARPAQVPSLYKSRDECLRDHPAGR